MTISILISVYNSEKPQYLNRALQSIWCNQTLKPDEIVLVEDGPLSVELLSIIKNWKLTLGDQLKIIRNEVNLGLTKSLNKGIDYIKSDFIARMDSDDISHPQRFEKQMAYLLSHPDVSVVGGSLQEFNSENECLNVRHYPLNNEDVLHYICKASPLAHPTVMIRREIFDNGIHYNERFLTSQDIALWYDILCAGYKIGNIDDVTIYFRCDDDVFKRRNKKKAFNEFKIYMAGINRLYGWCTWRYVYPIARLTFRLLPVTIIKWVYGSNIRKRILEKTTAIDNNKFSNENIFL
jgi:glycosyltransferase involved in cell wall biosynthesis